MRIFAIKDEKNKRALPAAYLLYYPNFDRFYIELSDDVDAWDLPPILSTFAERKEKTIGSYWSREWVLQRIVPSDRQNIGQILRDNGMKNYSLIDLLVKGRGRCAQDDFCVGELQERDMPEFILERNKHRLESGCALAGQRIIYFFKDGELRICNASNLNLGPKYQAVLQSDSTFRQLHVDPIGYSLEWDENLCITSELLHSVGTSLPITQKDLMEYIQQNVVTGTEAAEELNCSRQNLSDLVLRKKIRPIKKIGKVSLFLRSEIRKRAKAAF